MTKNFSSVPGFANAVEDVKALLVGRASHEITREEGRSVMRSRHLEPSYMRWVYRDAGEQLGVKVVTPNGYYNSVRKGNDDKPSNALKALASSSEIQEMLLLQNQYEKLLRKREHLSEEIDALKFKMDEIDRELVVYKPVQAALESMRTANQRVKDELVRTATTK